MGKCKTLAIIPARGGSSGLKRKNILPLCGKPLIAYSIESALASSRIDRVIVSTEDEEIAEVALRFGAEVPFLRPRNLAGSRCSPGRAIDHALRTLYGRNITDVIYTVLYPTHPFRPKGLLDLLVGKVADGCQHALTVAPFNVSRDSFFRIDEAGRLHGLFPPPPSRNGPPGNGCASELGVFYRPVGLASAHGAFPGRERNPCFLYPVTDKISLTDIDYLEDFLLAESVLHHNLFDFDAPCAS